MCLGDAIFLPTNLRLPIDILPTYRYATTPEKYSSARHYYQIISAFKRNLVQVHFYFPAGNGEFHINFRRTPAKFLVFLSIVIFGWPF